MGIGLQYRIVFELIYGYVIDFYITELVAS